MKRHTGTSALEIHPQAQSHLFRLPLEVRLLIYEHLFGNRRVEVFFDVANPDHATRATIDFAGAGGTLSTQTIRTSSSFPPYTTRWFGTADATAERPL